MVTESVPVMNPWRYEILFIISDSAKDEVVSPIRLLIRSCVVLGGTGVPNT